MTPEQILAYPPRVLSQAQRQYYFDHGYVKADSIVPDAWIVRIRAAIAELVDVGRTRTESDGVYELSAGHSGNSLRVERIINPASHHPVVWEYASKSLLADIAADLVGPNVKFLNTIMSCKPAHGGVGVKWHQDIAFMPHTNYSLLTIGTYLDDVIPEAGPMGVIPDSHNGPIYFHCDMAGQWTGTLDDDALVDVVLASAVYFTGPAGTVQIHNCRTVHGSDQNHSSRGRPILMTSYTSADAFSYFPSPAPNNEHHNTIVRGEPARQAVHDPRPCPIPPDRSQRKIASTASSD